MAIKTIYILTDDGTGEELHRSDNLRELLAWRRENGIISIPGQDYTEQSAMVNNPVLKERIERRKNRERIRADFEVKRERRKKAGKPAK